MGLKTIYKDIANATREMSDTTSKMKISEMADRIEEIPTGIDIQGLVESYKIASGGGTLSAGDFVEFINNWNEFSTGGDTTLISITNAYQHTKAVRLDNNRVFVTYCGTSSYLCAVVCTINGTTITHGTETTLISISSSYQYNSPVLIDTNKVFITHRYNYNLNGVVCTISGTTITSGTSKNLVTGSSSLPAYTYNSVVKIDTNKVFIAHRLSGGSYLSAMVCTISGTTITPGTDTTLVSGTNAFYFNSTVALNTTNVFIAHGTGGTNNRLAGIVCTISGTSITPGTDTTLVAVTGSYEHSSVVMLISTKVFIAHRGSASKLAGIVCTISGTTITPGTDTTIVSSGISYEYTSAVLVDEDKVFIAHRSDNTNDCLNAIVCTISGTTIRHGTDTILVSAISSYMYASAALVDENKVFIAHGSNDLCGIIIQATENIKKITTTTQTINGIAKTSGTEGETIEVYVPQEH